MKKILSLLSLAALTVGLLGSCTKINERIDSLEKRIDGIENTSIASVQQQIDGIKASITKLEAADVTVNGKIDELKATTEAHQKLIDALKEADKALVQKNEELEARIASLESQVATMNGQIKALEEADKAILVRIDELKTYIDTEIGKTKDWAEETFATLEQYQQTADNLAALSVTVTGISTTLTGIQTSISGLDTKIDGIDAALQSKITSAKTELEGQITSLKTELEDKIATAITASETSIKSWINELLKGYYTAAVVEAKIGSLNTAIEASKSTAKERIDSIAKELTALKTAVDTAKAAIRTEYKNAIDVAINKLDGEIRGAFLDSIAAVNGRIEALDTRVTTLEGKVLTLEGNVNKLLAMIQSVSITPAYSDGSVEAVDGILTLKCIVSPAKAISGMASLKDSLLLYADSVKVKTKATTPAYMTIKVSEASVLDAAQGAITLKADISEYLPKGEDRALTVAVNIKNGISDFTTEFVPVYVCVSQKTFKAVYNTNGGANTLTFYFDANDHSGDGITVYEDGTANDLFDNSKSNGAKWGYNGIRGSIKSVVIDASVAGYKGLTSTTFMFQGMATATNISGAEYLDVSNVTDMSFMFNNFGGGKSGSPTTLNVVPDVSKWNTGNVTNMTGMFESYGNFSSSLDKVPDVSNWNTGNVTDMTYMFQKYGHESQTFNAVPDVSKWNTGNVTNMANMFREYGHKSTALNAVPNVSGWNTGNVTNMKQMFNNYGSTSENISCVLDLSGWDLSKITETNGVNVFNFNPKTFDVTIPAKTGTKANAADKWYYGNGTNSIAPPADNTFTFLPAGTLNGVFSVSDTKKVHFSQGNLIATINASGTPTAWKFATNQYDYLGEGGANKTIGTAAGDVDLFGWSTSNNGGTSTTDNYGIKTSTSSDDYLGEFYDWGKAIGDGNTWRTLTIAEWQYLFAGTSDGANTDTSSPRHDLHKYGVTVCGKTNCVVLLPDYWVWDENTVGTSWQTAYPETADDSHPVTWQAMEAAGAICLPAAGGRVGSDVSNVGSGGYYWSSSAYDNNQAYDVFFYDSGVSLDIDVGRSYGFSVRLVTDIK